MPTLDHLNRKTKKQDKTEQKPFLNWVDKKILPLQNKQIYLFTQKERSATCM